jgi:hypothetical protein
MGRGRTMVLHDYAVHVGVLDRLDALEHDRSVPKNGGVRPRAESTRVALTQPRCARRKRSASLLIARAREGI